MRWICHLNIKRLCASVNHHYKYNPVSVDLPGLRKPISSKKTKSSGPGDKRLPTCFIILPCSDYVIHRTLALMIHSPHFPRSLTLTIISNTIPLAILIQL